MLDILLIIIYIFLIFYCFYNLNIILLLYLYNTLILTIYYIKKYTLINKNINFIQKINIYLSITILFLLLIYIYYSK